MNQSILRNTIENRTNIRELVYKQ